MLKTTSKVIIANIANPIYASPLCVMVIAGRIIKTSKRRVPTIITPILMSVICQIFNRVLYFMLLIPKTSCNTTGIINGKKSNIAARVSFTVVESYIDAGKAFSSR